MTATVSLSHTPSAAVMTKTVIAGGGGGGGGPSRSRGGRQYEHLTETDVEISALLEELNDS